MNNAASTASVRRYPSYIEDGIVHVVYPTLDKTEVQVFTEGPIQAAFNDPGTAYSAIDGFHWIVLDGELYSIDTKYPRGIR